VAAICVGDWGDEHREGYGVGRECPLLTGRDLRRGCAPSPGKFSIFELKNVSFGALCS